MFCFWSHFFPTCLLRATLTVSQLSSRAVVKCTGKAWSWSFCHVDSAKCLSFHLLSLEWEGSQWGICLTETSMLSAWILLGINPAIMSFVLFFFRLFLDRTSSWWWIVDAERRQVKGLWLHTPKANSICLVRFRVYFNQAFCDHEASSLTAPIQLVRSNLKPASFAKIKINGISSAISWADRRAHNKATTAHFRKRHLHTISFQFYGTTAVFSPQKRCVLVAWAW